MGGATMRTKPIRTFDERGNLLGDTAVDSGATLPAITVTAQRLPAVSWFDSLLQPPTVYYVGAGLAFLAYLMNENQRRAR